MEMNLVWMDVKDRYGERQLTLLINDKTREPAGISTVHDVLLFLSFDLILELFLFMYKFLILKLLWLATAPLQENLTTSAC